jgi:molybdopterin biosynthesis enzyme
MKSIPIAAAKQIAERYGYDQVIIIARAVGQGEHVTTYGKDKANCDVAARIGDFLKYKVMGWVKDH